MKTKLFMVGLVMAAAVVCLSCSGNTKEKKLKEIADGIEQLDNKLKNQQVPDDEVLINHVLYQISDTRKIYNHRGMETDNPDLSGDHIDHSRVLFPKEAGGFEVGYVVKTTRGVTLQSNKSFYFFRPPECFPVRAVILNVVDCHQGELAFCEIPYMPNFCCNSGWSRLILSFPIEPEIIRFFL